MIQRRIANRTLITAFVISAFFLVTILAMAYQGPQEAEAPLTLLELKLTSILGTELEQFEQIEGIQDYRCFVVQSKGREVVGFGLNTSGDVEFLILRATDKSKVVTISRKSDVFPGALSIRSGNPSNGVMPPILIIDSDLDGIPEAKIDFEKRICPKLNRLNWDKDQPIGSCKSLLSGK